MYITEAKARARLKERFDQFYDLTNKPDEFTGHVARAEGEVNSYLKRYVVPPTGGALDFVTELALDLFEAIAWTQYGAGGEIPKKVENAAKIARDYLKLVAQGTTILVGGTPADGPNNGSGTAIAVVSGPDAMFTQDRLKPF